MPYADPERDRIYHREYKRANRWRYRARQKFYDAAKHANVRAAAVGAEGTITPEEAEAILSVGRCHHCGLVVTPSDLTLDHVVAIVFRGLNRPANIVASCRSCNEQKHHGLSPIAWSGTVERCVDCGTTARPHLAKGRCGACYQRRSSWRAAARAAREGLPPPGS